MIDRLTVLTMPPQPVRLALAAWLQRHGIDPHAVTIPGWIERDEGRCRVRWQAPVQHPDGGPLWDPATDRLVVEARAVQLEGRPLPWPTVDVGPVDPDEEEDLLDDAPCCVVRTVGTQGLDDVDALPALAAGPIFPAGPPHGHPPTCPLPPPGAGGAPAEPPGGITAGQGLVGPPPRRARRAPARPAPPVTGRITPGQGLAGELARPAVRRCRGGPR